MTRLSFSVEHWSGPGHSTDSPVPVPMLLKRRVGTVGRKALEAAWQLGPDKAGHFVFSSRHGEFGRTLSLLRELATEHAVSPADFSLSVHNALAGLLSIASGNRNGLTAIAAGQESFGYGLLEAAALLAEQPSRPVHLVHFNEPFPDEYAEVAVLDDGPVAIALSVTAPDGTHPKFEIETTAAPPDSVPSRGLAEEVLRFLSGQDQSANIHGDRMMWRLRRDV
jgi:hypothetical protein